MTFEQIIMMVLDSFQYAIVLVFLSMVVSYFYKRNKNERMSKPIRMGAFLLYVYMLLYITVFRGGLFQNNYHIINLIPFDELLTSSFYQLQAWGKQSALLIFSYNVLGNIIWFVPLGIFLPTMFEKMNFIKCILYSFLLSFTIEVCQYVFYTGISDIDDIIFNVFGGIVGYGIYRFIITNTLVDKEVQ